MVSPRLGLQPGSSRATAGPSLKGHWGRYHRAAATGEFANVIGPNVKPYFAGRYDLATGEFTRPHSDIEQHEPGRRPELQEPLHRPVHPEPGTRARSRPRRLRELRAQERAATSPAGRRSKGTYVQIPFTDDIGQGATGRTFPIFQTHSAIPRTGSSGSRTVPEPTSRGQCRQLRRHAPDAEQARLQRLGHLATRHGHAAGRPGRRRRAGLRRRHHAARRPAVPPIRPQPQRVRQRRRAPARRRRVAGQVAARLPAAGGLPRLRRLLVPQRRVADPALSSVPARRHEHPRQQTCCYCSRAARTAASTA